MTYGVILIAGGILVGLGGVIAAATASGRSLGMVLWALASCLSFFSVAMAVAMAAAHVRRLSGLAAEVRRMARVGEPEASPGDPIAALAHCIGKMSERMAELGQQLEDLREHEQARVDALVRERTRQLAVEVEDLRRLLGPTKAFVSVDGQGRILGGSAANVLDWLGPPPEGTSFWDYLERGDRAQASRFEAAWRDMSRSAAEEIDLRRMPKSLALGDQYFTLEYRAVQAPGGQLERLLVLFSDISVSDPDSAAPV